MESDIIMPFPKRFIALSCAVGLSVSCAPQGEDSAIDPSKPPVARIVVLDENPFDLEAALEFGPVHLPRALQFLHERDTDTVNTNHDETKSLVLAVGEPVPVGTKIRMEIRAYDLKDREWGEYRWVNEVGPDSVTNPIIFVNG